MATATLTKLQNFINGELVDPADGATEEVVNPATGEPIAEARLSAIPWTRVCIACKEKQKA